MAAMMNSELEARIQHVNERINRLMDIVTRMEGKLQDVTSVLEGLRSGGNSQQALAVPQPRQLPVLSEAASNPMASINALMPLFQSVMEGTPPEPQTFLQGLTALINLREAFRNRELGTSGYRVPIRTANTTPGPGANNFVIFLILTLLIFGMRTT